MLRRRIARFRTHRTSTRRSETPTSYQRSRSRQGTEGALLALVEGNYIRTACLVSGLGSGSGTGTVSQRPWPTDDALGFEYILRKHAHTAEQRCPSLATKRISPHVLRHTCALTVLQATKNLRKVALWLGHVHMQTTEMYTRADPSVN